MGMSPEQQADRPFPHTDRPGFLFGLIDFCTAGLFFLLVCSGHRR